MARCGTASRCPAHLPHRNRVGAPGHPGINTATRSRRGGPPVATRASRQGGVRVASGVQTRIHGQLIAGWLHELAAAGAGGAFVVQRSHTTTYRAELLRREAALADRRDVDGLTPGSTGHTYQSVLRTACGVG